MSTAARAWVVLGAGVVVYEILAEDGQLLTHAVRRGCLISRRHRTAIHGGIIITAGHLLDVWGPVDPFRLLGVVRAARGRVPELWLQSCTVTWDRCESRVRVVAGRPRTA